MRITILGCGHSSGVPRIGGDPHDPHGDWGRCNPDDPKNNRLRASILVEHEGTRLLVDTGPDLRAQLLRAGIEWIDAVLYTHAHADHCHGIDDLRPLFHARRREIDCYMDAATKAQLLQRFSYVFEGKGGYPPTALAHLVQEEMHFGPIRVQSFRQEHGSIESVGYRFEAGGKSVAYSTDVHILPEESKAHVTGADLWIVDALRRKPHPTHSHLARTLGWIEELKPKAAWLTHMDQSMDHDELVAELPEPVSPAYDGRIFAG